MAMKNKAANLAVRLSEREHLDSLSLKDAAVLSAGQDALPGFDRLIDLLPKPKPKRVNTCPLFEGKANE